LLGLKHRRNVNAKKIPNLPAQGDRSGLLPRGWVANIPSDFTIAANWQVHVGFAPKPVPERKRGAHYKGSARSGTAGTNHRDRTRLALSSLSTRQRFERLVPDAVSVPRRPHPPIASWSLARSCWFGGALSYLETGVVPRGVPASKGTNDDHTVTESYEDHFGW